MIYVLNVRLRSFIWTLDREGITCIHRFCHTRGQTCLWSYGCRTIDLVHVSSCLHIKPYDKPVLIMVKTSQKRNKFSVHKTAALDVLSAPIARSFLFRKLWGDWVVFCYDLYLFIVKQSQIHWCLSLHRPCDGRTGSGHHTLESGCVCQCIIHSGSVA